ncbi:acetyl-CoA carboxylase biotin carboxyl carrier protein subunit [Enterococcus faecalis]
MLRKFKISIDGKEYLVEMEEIGGVPQPAPVAPQPTAPVATTETPAPAVEEAPAPAAQPAAPAGADAMPAPMPGTVLKVLVNVGDMVSENQPLLILEAMKMENEIVAGKAGTVTGIHVTQGQIVNPGEPLITIN